MDETVLSTMPIPSNLFAGVGNVETCHWLDFRVGFGYFEKVLEGLFAQDRKSKG
jgi:hypothetical protein